MPNPAILGLPHPHDYDTSGASVVADRVTGLTWQRSPVLIADLADNDAGSMPLPSAYCESLSLGGFDDWRLPSRIELVSVVDFSRRNPAIDPEAFPSTPSENFLASSLDCLDRAYIVNFYDGDTSPSAGDVYIRCVRGGAPALSPHYKIEAETVTDEATGLVWQRQASDPMLWSDAKTYCGLLGTAGGGWRLPGPMELQTLIAETRTPLAIDVAAFPGIPEDESGFDTTRRGVSWAMESPALSGAIWRVDFGGGNAIDGGENGLQLSVRCVR